MRPFASALFEQQRQIQSMAFDPDNHPTPAHMIPHVREARVAKFSEGNPDSECNLTQFEVLK